MVSPVVSFLNDNQPQEAETGAKEQQGRGCVTKFSPSLLQPIKTVTSAAFPTARECIWPISFPPPQMEKQSETAGKKGVKQHLSSTSQLFCTQTGSVPWPIFIYYWLKVSIKLSLKPTCFLEVFWFFACSLTHFKIWFFHWTGKQCRGCMISEIISG